MENELDEITKPSGWRVSLTIAIAVVWLIFVIVWLAFFAIDYSLNRNFAVILISVFALIIVLGGLWLLWGLKHIPKEGKEMMETKGFKSRIVISIILPLVLILFLIFWFFFYADNFNIYQNIAIFLVSVIAIGGIMGAMWAPWGMKYGKKPEDTWKEEKKG